jgi:hypothetical protein
MDVRLSPRPQVVPSAPGLSTSQQTLRTSQHIASRRTDESRVQNIRRAVYQIRETPEVLACSGALFPKLGGVEV